MSGANTVFSVRSPLAAFFYGYLRGERAIDVFIVNDLQ